MECKMKNMDLKKMNVILGKVGATSDPMNCWELSSRILDLDRLVEPIKKIEEDPEWISKYREERSLLISSLRKHVGDIQDPFGNKIARYEKKDDSSEEQLILKLNELEDKYKDEISREEKRKSRIAEVMEKEVDVKIEPIEYEWCFDNGKLLISTNELVFLRKHDLVVKKENTEDSK